MTACCELTEYGIINKEQLLLSAIHRMWLATGIVRPAIKILTSPTFGIYFKLRNSNNYECVRTLKIIIIIIIIIQKHAFYWS